jgi:pimeloyl-ACP methyl ester carboxylesterase
MHEVEVSGLRISYEVAGTGPALVLLHGGFGLDSRSWRRQIDAFSDAYTVVAWDAPGCGRSSDPPQEFGLPDYADCLAGFIRAVGLSRPHVLGLSFGGALALQLYDRHPMLPRTLIFAGAYAGWAGSLAHDEVERRLERLAADMQRPTIEWIDTYLPGMLTETATPELVDEVRSLMAGVRPVGHQVMLRAMAEADLRDVLPRVAVPTLLLYGEQDVRSPVAVGRALHDGIHGSTLIVLPGVGHLSNVEGAERFDREVRSFLELHAH